MFALKYEKMNEEERERKQSHHLLFIFFFFFFCKKKNKASVPLTLRVDLIYALCLIF